LPFDVSTTDAGELGDISPEEFRKQLHEVADWIANYREQIAERRISPNVKPGEVLAQLETKPPEAATSSPK